MFSGIVAALGVVKNITYNDIYSFDIEIKKINLEEFEDGISPGQACVFYGKDQFGHRVLGGGWIKE